MDRQLAVLKNVIISLGVVIVVLAGVAVWRASPQTEHDFGKLTDWLLIIFSALLAAFTFLLWKSTDKLWKAGERQIEVAIKAAIAAQQSAEFANAQVRLSRVAMETTDRAYVVLDPFRIRPVKDKESGNIIKWTFQASWRNRGSTPTKCMVNNFFAEHRILPDELELTKVVDAGLDGAVRVILGPSRYVFSPKIEIELDMLEKIKAGNAASYFWGWADYNDVFEGTPRHRTEFCARLVVHGDPAHEDCRFGHAHYGEFNGIDDECSEQPRVWIQP